jgi:predicted  nucleic acid-binding Zn-ribbon protein
MLTNEEQERAAYQAGHLSQAAAYGRISDLQKALGETLARNLKLESALADADNRLDRQDDEIAHLKRAQAALEE